LAELFSGDDRRRNVCGPDESSARCERTTVGTSSAGERNPVGNETDVGDSRTICRGDNPISGKCIEVVGDDDRDPVG
jgi:hypothetical protein